MFVFTLRGSTIKIVSLVLLSVIALALVLVFLPGGDVLAVSTNVSFDKIKTNEDRIAFLSQFGWQVAEEPVAETTVTIPAEFDRVFLAYNNIQQQQGLDLSAYQKKNVSRYTYLVTNYPDYNGKVYANLLVFRGKVIGGDICAADVSGFMHGFTKEAALPSD